MFCKGFSVALIGLCLGCQAQALTRPPETGSAPPRLVWKKTWPGWRTSDPTMCFEVWDQCPSAAMAADEAGGVFLSMRRPAFGEATQSAEAKPALYHVDRAGKVLRTRLGSPSDDVGEVVFLAVTDGEVVAASRFGDVEDEDARIVLSLRDGLGEAATASLTLHNTRRAWRLNEGSWLVVNARESHAMKILPWSRTGHEALYWHHSPKEDDGSPERLRDVYHVAAWHEAVAVVGTYIDERDGDPVLRHPVGVLDSAGDPRWQVAQRHTNPFDIEFDTQGNLWVAGVISGVAMLGPGRFPVTPRHPWALKRRIVDYRYRYKRTLFQEAFRRRLFYRDQSIVPGEIRDGLLLR